MTENKPPLISIPSAPTIPELLRGFIHGAISDQRDADIKWFEQYCRVNNIYQVLEDYDSPEGNFNSILKEVRLIQ